MVNALSPLSQTRVGVLSHLPDSLSKQNLDFLEKFHQIQFRNKFLSVSKSGLGNEHQPPLVRVVVHNLIANADVFRNLGNAVISNCIDRDVIGGQGSRRKDVVNRHIAVDSIRSTQVLLLLA